MGRSNTKDKFVVCIKNDGYPASLEVRKIYRVLPDNQSAEHHLVRIIDESGESYLYPEDFFAAIEIPRLALRAFTVAD